MDWWKTSKKITKELFTTKPLNLYSTRMDPTSYSTFSLSIHSDFNTEICCLRIPNFIENPVCVTFYAILYPWRDNEFVVHDAGPFWVPCPCLYTPASHSILNGYIDLVYFRTSAQSHAFNGTLLALYARSRLEIRTRYSWNWYTSSSLKFIHCRGETFEFISLQVRN